MCLLFQNRRGFRIIILSPYMDFYRVASRPVVSYWLAAQPLHFDSRLITHATSFILLKNCGEWSPAIDCFLHLPIQSAIAQQKLKYSLLRAVETTIYLVGLQDAERPHGKHQLGEIPTKKLKSVWEKNT